MGVAKFNAEHRDFIARQFAAFATPTDTVDAFQAEFNQSISVARLYQLRVELKVQIREAQAEFLNDMSEIPLAHSKMRVIRLAEMAAQARKDKKPGLELQILMALERETEHLKGASGNSTSKEAVAFLHALCGGSESPRGVLPDAQPRHSH